ncbi:unnamed protein product [Scytosiphon promiscuus]
MQAGRFRRVLQRTYCVYLSAAVPATSAHSSSFMPPTAQLSGAASKRCSSSSSPSGTSFLYEQYADSPNDLVELMRRIVRRGGRGRKQDNVPKEVVKVFCERYSQLDQDGKEELLLSMARRVRSGPDSEYQECVSTQPDVMTHTPLWAVRRSMIFFVRVATQASMPRHPSAHQESVTSGGAQQQHQHVKAYERLREELSPAYEALLKNVVAESDDGVRFVVDLREDLLEVIRRNRRKQQLKQQAGQGTGTDPLLLALDGSIRSLLQAWFSVGFLELRRITYQGSNGALLEKIARYEAVHPVGSLSELKARLGEGRRCFGFFHPCLPDEPLVFVHVALLPEVAGSMAGIVNLRDGSGGEGGGRGGEGAQRCEESEARSAVFYSISATQKGLQGVQLGNFLIKRVVAQLRAELPQLETFATLSPIPSFRSWLEKKAKHRAALGAGRSSLSGELLLTRDEAAAILRSNSCAAGTNAAATGPAEAISSGGGGGGYGSDREGDSRREAEALALLLSSSDGGGGAGSGRGAPTGMAAESALTRLAARYLVRETVRGKIPDPVGNFHISNGARVERVNWMADLSPRGIENSFGVMVNYVYDPLEIESNNRLYLSRGEVPASDGARELAWSLRDAEARSAGEGDPKDGGRDGGGRHGAGGEGQTPPRAAL